MHPSTIHDETSFVPRNGGLNLVRLGIAKRILGQPHIAPRATGTAIETIHRLRSD
jgi:hypothetical protein